MKTLQNNLQQDVLDELQWEPSIDSARIGVAVDNGVVVLNGAVRSLAERQAAERAVKRVKGVSAVANELRVEIAGEHVRDDVSIAKAARDALRWHTNVPDQDLKVSVTKGWITLEGQVASAFQRQAAEGAVVHLTGVVGVTNRITIRPMQTSVDVRRLLTAALHRHARVEADNIQTWFADGKVTLHGKIRSWAERDAVEAAAWSAPGVADVENLIEVRT